MQFNYCKCNDTFIRTSMFWFQLATGGIEREVYIKLIEPFMHDLPASAVEGFRRVCTDHNYAYFGSDLLNPKFSLSIPCKVIKLPGNSYRIQSAFIIPKNSPYKGLINWR